MLRDAIIGATQAILADGGLTECSVERISGRSGCAKGLINYHFRSKRQLLGEVAQSMSRTRFERRYRALGQSGTAALDALWQVLVEEVETGEARGWRALLGDPWTFRQIALSNDQLTDLAGAAARALAVEDGSFNGPVIGAALEGLQLEMLRGRDPAELRDGFDSLWLALLEATS